MKYRPDFPERFGSIQQARDFCRRFFAYYNCVHRHSGIGLHTPSDVRRARAAVLDQAYAAHPERFVRKPPEPPALPGPAWINKPAEDSEDDSDQQAQ